MVVLIDQSLSSGANNVSNHRMLEKVCISPIALMGPLIETPKEISMISYITGRLRQQVLLREKRTSEMDVLFF